MTWIEVQGVSRVVKDRRIEVCTFARRDNVMQAPRCVAVASPSGCWHPARPNSVDSPGHPDGGPRKVAVVDVSALAPTLAAAARFESRCAQVAHLLVAVGMADRIGLTLEGGCC